MKIDMKNEREKSYKNGWFGTTLKEKKINKLSDICDWIEDMCELAEKGSKRQLWGAKKKDDRGMLGILNVCQKNDAFNKIKDLPHGIFDCVNLKKLLDEITKCVKNTYVGRTKSSGFSKSLGNCLDYLRGFFNKLRDAGTSMQKAIDGLNVPNQLSTKDGDACFKLGGIIFNLEADKIVYQQDYKTLAEETNKWLSQIINSCKMEYCKIDNYKTRVADATESLKYVIETEDSWIDEKNLGPTLANNLKSNLKTFNNLLKNNKIKFEEIKEDDEDDGE